MKRLLYFVTGILFYPFTKWFPVNKAWIFGAQHGETYVDNSKYLFEYMLVNHPEVPVYWVTGSVGVKRMLRSSKKPVVLNFSIKGIYLAATARFVVFSTSRNDILFAFHKHGRKIINLWHGMPIKKIVYDYLPHRPENKSFKGKLWDSFVAGIRHHKVDLIASTSDFFSNILGKAFMNKNVYVTGLPRNDVFATLNKNEIKLKMGLSQEDYVVTYMPTHRNYGKGLLNPKIFINDPVAQKRFQDVGIKVLWKFHKNMLSDYGVSSINNPCLVDISLRGYETQEVLFISDFLITDYSSCYVDFLLLKRPVGFYLYDNYESEDNELYYHPRDHKIGYFCTNENDLLKLVIKAAGGELKYYQNEAMLYHKNFDSKASERIFNLINQ